MSGMGENARKKRIGQDKCKKGNKPGAERSAWNGHKKAQKGTKK
jgi:hypothetical protein